MSWYVCQPVLRSKQLTLISVMPRIRVELPLEYVYLFKGLIVHETGGIFRNLELSFLDLLAKLPMQRLVISRGTRAESWIVGHANVSVGETAYLDIYLHDEL